MSRENKVNPSQYTQRGRLTPDDAAREMAKQRQSFFEPRGKGNPKSRSEAWIQQAAKAREIVAQPLPQPGHAWVRVATFLMANAAVICFSVYCMRRLRVGRDVSEATA
ncbi:MAG: hypothetical protein Q7R30_13640 [Acidobacteriota bacterium]|nr:hypothetical protein [Acidobacteriota bacterium]